MNSPPAPTRRTFAIVGIAAFSYTCLMFIWFTLPAYLSPIIDELGLSSTEAGIVVGAVPLTYIPLALLSGLFVDRVGPGRSLAIGVLLFGLAQIGRSTVSDFWSLLGFTILIGVGATTITFGLPKLVSMLFPPDRTGAPSAIYLVAANTGSATAFALGRPLIGPLLGGWRPLFFWSGLLAVVYAIGWLGLALLLGLDNVGDPSDGSLQGMVDDLLTVLSHRELQVLVLIGTMYLLVGHGVQGWLPTVLEDRGISAAVAGVTTSGFVVALVVGIVTVPTIADRLGRRPTALSVCGIFVSVGVLTIMFAPTPGLSVVGVVIAGIGAGGISPLLRAMPPAFDGIGARLTGTAVGFIFAVGEIGGFLGPVLIGALHETTGSFLPGFGLLAIGGLVVAVLGVVLRRMA